MREIRTSGSNEGAGIGWRESTEASLLYSDIFAFTITRASPFAILERPFRPIFRRDTMSARAHSRE